MSFDPSGFAVHNGNFLGLPWSPEESEIVLLGLPWDVTTSYRDGTSRGPQAVIDASYQLDFSNPFLERGWETRIATLPISRDWLEKNRDLREKASRWISFLEKGGDPSHPEMRKLLDGINEGNEKFHQWVEEECARWLDRGKRVVALGGDHSVSFGAIKAVALRTPVSILHIDAHADLRDAYEGFHHSHASIMFNARKIPGVHNIVQVGIRDWSPDEEKIIRESGITTFFDWDLRAARARGITWHEQCDRILEKLGPKVYLSFDIDGLDPRFCPHTGTPVPGGLDHWEALYLLNRVVESGKELVGADLVEVAPGPEGSEWDANVGARTLYAICQLIKKSG
ncbi:MAG: agmatinase family protein [Bdellovibrionales bacterium]|nr:agmatinase family protein [Bdellovibrionales bacterium]